jgi:BirA family biotin operon repressor/biotin-[acetyl-CoA-carboxylase] ligase
MAEPAPIEHWPTRLEAVLPADGLLKRIFVMRETDSTQEAAQRMNAVDGDVIVAWRQTAGRGRLGRAWADTGEAGTACTFVVALDAEGLEKLAIASAVGTAHAVEAVLGRPVGIKWPNDIVIDGRKLAGILIETAGGAASIGVGINVFQLDWPADLADRAVSLAQLGCVIDRIELLEKLLPEMDAALRIDAAAVVGAFAARDVLTGTEQAFRCGERVVAGRVLRVDPLHGLAVRVDGEEIWLPAATTTVQEACRESR